MKIIVMLYSDNCSDQPNALWYLLIEYKSRAIFKLGQWRKGLGKQMFPLYNKTEKLKFLKDQYPGKIA